MAYRVHLQVFCIYSQNFYSILHYVCHRWCNLVQGQRNGKGLAAHKTGSSWYLQSRSLQSSLLKGGVVD
ncbi:hypothetical protein DsansV1_C05g0055581 [Dioscorea sansibarensis]